MTGVQTCALPIFFEGFGPQIKHLGELLTSKPMLLRIPNQQFLVNDQKKGVERILACTSTDKSYAMVYTPRGEPFKVDLAWIKGKRIYWYWFNPRNGEINSEGYLRTKNRLQIFTPPTTGPVFSGNDWVLVITLSGG